MVNCPECNNKMGKFGRAWSGRKRVQRYKCSRCGATKYGSLETKKGGVRWKL